MKRMKWIAPLLVMVAICVTLSTVTSCGGGAPQRNSTDSTEMTDTTIADNAADSATAIATGADSLQSADSLANAVVGDSGSVIPADGKNKNALVQESNVAESDSTDIVGDVIDDIDEGNFHRCQGQGVVIVTLILVVLLFVTLGLPLIVLLITHLIDKSRRDSAVRRNGPMAEPKTPIVTKLSVAICFIVFLLIIALALFVESFSAGTCAWVLYMVYLAVNFFRAIFRKL